MFFRRYPAGLVPNCESSDAELTLAPADPRETVGYDQFQGERENPFPQLVLIP